MDTTDYCDYKLSLALKACGFDEPCIAQWACEPDGKPILVGSTAFVFSNSELKGRDVTAPLLYHAQKWLREKWDWHIDVSPAADCSLDADGQVCEEWNYWAFDIMHVISTRRIVESIEQYGSYEQALSAGIAAALELIKKGE